MNSRILTLLGFASKASKLGFGFDSSAEAMKKKKSKLIIVANDISKKTLKEIVFFAEKYQTKHIILEDIDIEHLSKAVGRKCGIITVNDEGFANACVDIGGNANDK